MCDGDDRCNGFELSTFLNFFGYVKGDTEVVTNCCEKLGKQFHGVFVMDAVGYNF